MKPDIVILTGSLPEIENNMAGIKIPEAIIVASGVSSWFDTPEQGFFTSIDTVHLVRKHGAYIKPI
jgi:hypothetical protein